MTNQTKLLCVLSTGKNKDSIVCCPIDGITDDQSSEEEMFLTRVIDAAGDLYVKTHSPLSPHCTSVIIKGPICHDGYDAFRGQRSYAMCRAFDLMERKIVDSLSEGLTAS
jgi:hypothetical protein